MKAKAAPKKHLTGLAELKHEESIMTTGKDFEQLHGAKAKKQDKKVSFCLDDVQLSFVPEMSSLYLGTNSSSEIFLEGAQLGACASRERKPPEAVACDF